MTKPLLYILFLACVGASAQAQCPNVDTLTKISNNRKGDDARRDTVIENVRCQLQKIGYLKSQIPEYHDEQRFIDWPAGKAPARTDKRPEGKFGPVANVFASPYLNDFTQEWQFLEHGARGVLSAVVFVDTTAGSGLPAPYTNLGLRPGMNCLYLVHAEKDEWSAYMTQSAPNAAGNTAFCDPTAAEPKKLSVARRARTQASASAYAPVTRFDESASGIQMIGVKCLSGWCQIGPAAGTRLKVLRASDHFMSTATLKNLPASRLVLEAPAVNRSATPATRASTEIDDSPLVMRLGKNRYRMSDGHFDAQWLTEIRGGKLVPSVFATVFPAADITTHGTDGFKALRAVSVVVLATDPPEDSKYYKWGLRKGTNEVFLHETAGVWTMQVGSSRNPPMKLGVQRMTHMDVGIPPTARWRYLMLDDGVWIPCGMACCRADDGT